MNTTLLVTALGAALLDFLWQGLLVGCAAAVALAMLGNARPQARYLVACIALGLCLALPVATFVRGLAPPAAAQTTTTTGTATVMTVIGGLSVAGELPTSSATALPVANSRWQQWRQSLQPRLPLLVTLWSLGAALLALRMAFGLAWIATAGGARSRPHLYWQAQLDALAERMELSQRVLLRVVDGLDSPAAARVWRPVVLLPAALIARMPADLLEALLAHELAHVRRHDYLVNLLQSLVEALLFYHPVVWWLSRRIRGEREQIADDLAAQAIGDPRRLARALAELAECNDPVPTPTLALAAAGGTLMSRIQRLLRPRRQALDWKLVLPVLGMSVVCVAAFAQPQSPPMAAPSGIVSDIAGDDRQVPGSEDTYVVDSRPATRAEAERAAALAEREAELAAHYAERDAANAARGRHESDSLETQGSIRIGGRPGSDGDYAVVGRDHRRMLVSASLDDLRNVEGLRDRVGADFLWTRRDGRAYVLTDPTLIAQVRAAWAPTEPVSREMDALGTEMEKHGNVMEEIGARMEAQADVGNDNSEAMEALGEQMSDLGSQQAEVSARMARLSHDAAYAEDDAAREAAEQRLKAVENELETLADRMEALGSQMQAHGDALERAHAPLEALGDEMQRAGEPMEALGKQMDVLGEKMETLSEAADAATRQVIELAARDGKLVPVETIATR